MAALGFGARTALLAWVALTAAAVSVGTVLAFWGELLITPGGPGADGRADPSVAETAIGAPLLGAWGAGLAQVLLGPLAVAIGIGAGGWAGQRRRATPRPGRRARRGARRPRGGSR